MRTHAIGTGRARAVALAVLIALGATLAHGRPAGQRAGAPEPRPWRWAAYYVDAVGPEELEEFQLLVFDPDRHPPLAPLADRGQLLLAYVSLTEVGAGRAFFDRLSRVGALIEPHPHWTGAHYIDIRRKEWGSILVEQIVPQVLAAGFDGLFLDTLDDAELFERRDGKRFGGMQASAAALVKMLRRHYPSIPLMVNRGYAVLPQIARDVDYVLGESVQGSFDAESKRYVPVAEHDVAWQVDMLRAASARNPRLKVLTLDYWSPDDGEGIRAIYDAQRRRGFHPYVATPMLDQVVKEPR